MQQQTDTNEAIKQQLHKLDGIVRYKFKTDSDGSSSLDAKWVSTRTVDGVKSCPGRAYRRSSPGGSGSIDAFEGAWVVEYYGLDGKLQGHTIFAGSEEEGRCKLL